MNGLPENNELYLARLVDNYLWNIDLYNITEVRACMEISNDFDETGPVIIYAVKGYYGEQLVCQINIDSGPDGCFVSDTAFKRRAALFKMTMCVGDYLAYRIWAETGRSNKVARTVRYLPSLTGKLSLPEQ